MSGSSGRHRGHRVGSSDEDVDGEGRNLVGATFGSCEVKAWDPGTLGCERTPPAGGDPGKRLMSVGPGGAVRGLVGNEVVVWGRECLSVKQSTCLFWNFIKASSVWCGAGSEGLQRVGVRGLLRRRGGEGGYVGGVYGDNIGVPEVPGGAIVERRHRDNGVRSPTRNSPRHRGRRRRRRATKAMPYCLPLPRPT